MINFIKRIFSKPYYTKGISWDNNSNKYRAYFQFRKKGEVLYHYIGLYKTKQEAIEDRYKFIKSLI